VVTYLEKRMLEESFFDTKLIRENWKYLLWDVLMFQAWLEIETNA